MLGPLPSADRSISPRHLQYIAHVHLPCAVHQARLAAIDGDRYYHLTMAALAPMLEPPRPPQAAPRKNATGRRRKHGRRKLVARMMA